MITAHQLEVRAGARLLMEDVTFRVAAGDKVGLVGRNGAGKTTLTKILAGEALPAVRHGARAPASVGYLPQDPRTGDPEVLARDRILSARGLDDVVRRLREAEAEMGSDDPDVRDRGDAALRRGPTPSCTPAAATPPRPRPRQIASQPRHRGPDPRPAAAAPCPAASGAASSWPGSCSPAPRRCCSTSPPTTSTPTRSCWLREFLKAHKGGLIVISHDVGAARGDASTRCSTSTPTAAEIDVYNMGWTAYLAQRETDEQRRKRERMNAENKAKTLTDQANKMRAKATKAQAAQSMLKRAEKLMAGPRGRARGRQGRADQVPRARRRAARRRSPPRSCRSPTARSRSSPTSTWPSTRAAGW